MSTKRDNPARMIAHPHWEPLAEAGKPRPDLREAMRGHAGVYLLRKRGAKRVAYVGSSVPGEKQKNKKPAPLRLWKTILRHFQACKTRGGKYSFGDDNFCEPGNAGEYELAVMLTTPSEARELERRAIVKFKPIHMPREMMLEADDVPF